MTEDSVAAIDVLAMNDSTSSMIPAEARRLTGYIRLRKESSIDPDTMVCYLNQEPRTHCQYRASDFLGTLIRNTHMLYVYSAGRWFCPSELLLMQGFLAKHSLATHNEQSSFLDMGAVRSRRPRIAVINQAGNSMHTNAIGIAMLFGMFLVKYRPQYKLSPLLKRLAIIHRNRHHVEHFAADDSDSE